MKHNKGASIVEMLVAMSILVIVLGMATAGVVMALRVHRTQEAVTASQTKLRRVNEAVSQEIRGAVLGGLTNSPYSASGSSVSFTVMDGGAGYEVSGLSSTQVNFIANAADAAELDFGSGKALLVDPSGLARLLDINSVTASSGNRFTLHHATCTSNFPLANTLLFKVSTVGFNYDDSANILYQSVDNTAEQPLAFDLTDFTISYIYQKSDGTTETKETPYVDSSGRPLRVRTDAGITYTLARLELQISTEANVTGIKTIERSYAGQVELVSAVNSNQNRVIQGVSPCS